MLLAQVLNWTLVQTNQDQIEKPLWRQHLQTLRKKSSSPCCFVGLLNSGNNGYEWWTCSHHFKLSSKKTKIGRNWRVFFTLMYKVVEHLKQSHGVALQAVRRSDKVSGTHQSGAGRASRAIASTSCPSCSSSAATGLQWCSDEPDTFDWSATL